MGTPRGSAAHLGGMTVVEHPTQDVVAIDCELDSGTVVTLVKPPVATLPPRIQVQLPGCRAMDCGVVDAPERFGSYETPEQFRQWVRNFADAA